jgi:hypothetical protein
LGQAEISAAVSEIFVRQIDLPSLPQSIEMFPSVGRHLANPMQPRPAGLTLSVGGRKITARRLDSIAFEFCKKASGKWIVAGPQICPHPGALHSDRPFMRSGRAAVRQG